ncbi:MAG: polysaccharide pyruvyl transferase family protein [Dechloromonas sp.]|jgi:succinoglycan biosynthesis protein ExoV|nr:polysaccharide pyruvyl transferase family protein [Dechloromonas sp.]
MKLYYYRDPIGNFGDDLNPWIWTSLLPEILDGDDKELFLGIGTVINSAVPAAPRKLVFGAGLGYVGMPAIDARWRFRFVRGPLTAHRLGLDSRLAITDPAILVATLLATPEPEKRYPVSYMPHHVSTRMADWQHLCTLASVNYLDPAANIHETLLRIRQSRVVLCEAMHGAIVADALRVPWIPVSAYDHILEFKWRDWCQTVNLDYRPQHLPRVFDAERLHSLGERQRNRVKRLLRAAGIWSPNWRRPPPARNLASAEGPAVEALADLARRVPPLLSETRVHSNNLSRVHEEIERLRRDFE